MLIASNSVLKAQSDSLQKRQETNTEYRKKKLDKNSWFPIPVYTRNFFSPTARTLEKGESIYSNTDLFHNKYDLGFTDHLQIGVGLTIGIWGTVKLGFQLSENLYVAGGIQYGALLLSHAHISHLPMVYGIATFGSKNDNITVGGGSFNNNAYLSISGMTRIYERLALITDNFIFDDRGDHAFISASGIRYYREKTSFDLALGLAGSDGLYSYLYPFPYLSVLKVF